MTAKERNTYIEEFRDFRKSVTSSKKSAQQFMVDAGIHDKNGKLNKTYK